MPNITSNGTDFRSSKIVEENEVKSLANELAKSRNEVSNLRIELDSLKATYAKFESIETENTPQNRNAETTEDFKMLKMVNRYLRLNNEDLRGKIEDLHIINKQVIENKLL